MKNDLFKSIKQNLNPSSYLSSIVLKGSSNNIINSSNILIDILFRKEGTNKQSEQQCGFWDVNTTRWSTFGCVLIQKTSSNQFYECQCNHTTFFALLGGLNELITDEIILIYVIPVSISVFLGLIVIVLIVIKLFKIDKSGLERVPALYSTLSTFFSLLFYIFSSLFMIAILYNKKLEYSIDCSLLGFGEQFTLLSYFFWLLNTIMMYYFTNRFKINNMLKYFKPLSVLSFSK